MGIKWVYKVPWYNTTICIKLNCQSFKDYLKIGRKYRYAFICDVDMYDKHRVSIPNDASGGCGITMPSTSSKQ